MSRKSSYSTLFAAALFGAAAALFVGCTSLLGDFEVSATSDDGGSGSGKANGEACAAGTECSSSFCADGVCCESACSGTCETCSLDKGKCVPVPDGQNPDNECPSEPRPDAGAVSAPDAEAPPDDSGVSEGGSEKDAAGTINLPEAGVTSEDKTCGGTCNGARACKYPGKETTCGTKFCNTPAEAARFACDGKGHCDITVEACKDYSCEEPANTCRTDCAEPNDCQTTDFCNGGKCQPKLANGLGCTLNDQCKSGFCVTTGAGGGVCCNSACDASSFGPGASCTSGQCKCSVNCGAGSCRLYYRDADNDTYGDKSTATAVVGCDNASPPSGYVADNTDCDDGDANVRPNQTAYFGTPRPNGTYDYNCSGKEEKETNEYPGGSCQFCYLKTTCGSQSTCSAAGDQSRLTCAPFISKFCGGIGTTCTTCGYSLFESNTAGFTTTVACGASSTSYRSCGKCQSAGGGPPLQLVQNVQQRCR